MCDTIIALGNVTKNGRLIFGKNSDREPDEPQNIKIIPAKDYKEEEKSLKCTYIEIEQVKHTNEIFLCQPSWIWGGEIGANEHGVVIGNEALFPRKKLVEKERKLIGMDLLRLGLERGNTAVQARDIIIELMEKHGQGGPCGFRNEFYYMNGYIIADPKQAFVLETVGKEWAWKEIKDFWSISNIISLTDDFDKCSDNLIPQAIEEGWCSSEDDFNFREAYSDTITTWGGAGKKREESARCQLQEYSKNEELTIESFMKILRSHNYPEESNWRIDKGIKGTLCKHAANSITRPDSTTCSLVAELRDPNQSNHSQDIIQDIYLTTAASNPCITPYFPVYIGNTEIPKDYKNAKEKYDPEAFWWMLEKIHRNAILNYEKVHDIVKPQIKEFERNLMKELRELYQKRKFIPQDKIDLWFEQSLKISHNLGKAVENLEATRLNFIYKRFWKKYNKMNFSS